MSELFVYSSDSDEEINYELLSKSENNNIKMEIEQKHVSNLDQINLTKLKQINLTKLKQINLTKLKQINLTKLEQKTFTNCKKIIRN
jgi:hypothetical protein